MTEYRKIFFAFPCKHGAVRLETTSSFVRDLQHVNNLGWDWVMRAHVGDSFIQRSRNILVGLFLLTDCTDLVWIDDDVGWEDGALIKLIQHPVDFVAATYRVKDDRNIRYPMAYINNVPRDPDPETGLIEVETVPLGFARITRESLMRMIEQRKDTWFNDLGVLCYDLHDVLLLKKRTGYDGEDYTFCRRWRDCGQQVWIDPKIKMMHVGEKTFEGCLWDDLEAIKPQDTAARIREALNEGTVELPAIVPDYAQQSPIEFKWLMNYVVGSESILEVGSCIGHSLKAMAKHCVAGAKLRSIDLGKVNMNGDFETAGFLLKAIDELKAEGFDADVMISDSKASEAIKWAERSGPYDFVYIDGDHTYEGVKADFENYGPLGRIVGFHDIGHAAEEVVRFWNELKASGRYKTAETIASNMGTGIVFMDEVIKAEAAE